MSFALVTCAGTVEKIKQEEDVPKCTRALFRIYPSFPPIVLRCFGKKAENISQGASLAVIGQAKLEDSKQEGLRKQLVVDVRSLFNCQEDSILYLTAVGRLGQDPEVKSLNDTQVANLGIAVDDLQKNTSWFDFDAWDKKANVVSNYCSKGTLIGVSGPMKYDSWEKNGTQFKLKATAYDLDLLGGKGNSSSSSSAAQEVANNFDGEEF